MKKIILLAILIINLVLTGCTISMGSSSTDTFTSEAEKLADLFMDTEDELEILKAKETISNQDQQVISERLEDLIDQIQYFKKEEAPEIAAKIEEIMEKDLDKKEEVFLDLQEKAQNGDLAHEDIDRILKEVSGDFEFKPFD